MSPHIRIGPEPVLTVEGEPEKLRQYDNVKDELASVDDLDASIQWQVSGKAWDVVMTVW
jgi:hypothetical protein